MKSVLWIAHQTRNRHAEAPVIERVIEFQAADLTYFGEHWDDYLNRVREAIESGGITEPGETFPPQCLPDHAMERFGSLLCQLSLLIQQKCGHRVAWYSVESEQNRRRCTCLVEHEHCDVGMNAVKLAWEILVSGRREVLEPFQKVREFAKQRLLPSDTQKIVELARRRGIPCWKMDRYPYGRDPNDVRSQDQALRRNGLLALGQGSYRLEVEGTLCRQRSPQASRLLRDQEEAVRVCSACEVPFDGLNRQGSRNQRTFLVTGLGFMAEIDPGGRLTELGSEVRATDPSFLDAAKRIFGALDAGLLAVTIQAKDFSRPWNDECCVTKLDPAPDLSGAEPEGTPLLEKLISIFLDWLFPPGSKYRIPVAGITGSNGKTTTSRMLTHILECHGNSVGLASTDGVYVNGKMKRKGDQGGSSGHVEVLFNPTVDVAVLETHHSCLFGVGLIFDSCDVAICTQVTDEHIKPGKIESLDQMIGVKQFLLESARKAVIINADDPGCLTMLPRLDPPLVYLISARTPAAELRKLTVGPSCQCVLEPIKGTNWLVLYADGNRVPLLPAEDIPATFGGKAEFNVTNALLATAAGHALGVSTSRLVAALASFEASHTATPGRLNFHDNGVFRVLLDFAHNADGLKALCRFTDQLTTNGRKLLLFAMSGDRRDEAILAAAEEVAGHFDHYICRRYPNSRGREPQEVPELLSAGLRSAGVDATRITVAREPNAAVSEILAMGQAGDLVVMTHSDEERESVWGQVLSSGRQTRG